MGSMEGRKEMFYLTTHSTHFIYGYMASDKVKDHSDNEKGNPLPPHRLLFLINSKGYFICTIPQTGYHIPQPLLHQSWGSMGAEGPNQNDTIVVVFWGAHYSLSTSPLGSY